MRASSRQSDPNDGAPVAESTSGSSSVAACLAPDGRADTPGGSNLAAICSNHSQNNRPILETTSAGGGGGGGISTSRVRCT